ncbi:ABC transporter substrate-binding protein [Bradyrhizobium jicamae]|uniref:ABC transporter substrate-binding protein n=2 Tax=Bradyrhizobium jicamae TaxID=280332 RepID=A0ABS5FDU7_9BRAD|nr:ABC transporter substrate-binding protein [Bradyrhizobium jicamae]MBR0794973.1 ABC transporter substrate-binding protein [Bradyrhizobium jicamae]MBR0939048.1 ABC transporter substrate-binding protein [Bradyrhizobium jicamae]
MRRREFMSFLGAAMWPLAAHAQQPIPVVGFLNGASPRAYASNVSGFLLGLKETGYIEGQNVAIEYRWAEGHYDRLPAMAADLVQRQVAVIAANTSAVPAATAATTKIPIVFLTANDPVEAGLVKSLNRPGGNVTGVSLISGALGAKQLEVLHEVVPAAKSVAFLVNRTNPNMELYIRGVQEAARTLGQEIEILNASTEAEIDAAFQRHRDALVVAPDGFFIGRSSQLATLALRNALPTMCPFREFTAGGGLMSYGVSLPDQYRQFGIYAGKILQGASPADLPVLQPTKFELVINLKTAKTLGLAIPPGVLARADEVIE